MRSFITAIIVAACLYLFVGWEAMLGIGIVHAHLLYAVRPIDYGTTLLLVVLFAGVFGMGAKAGK